MHLAKALHNPYASVTVQQLSASEMSEKMKCLMGNDMLEWFKSGEMVKILKCGT